MNGIYLTKRMILVGLVVGWCIVIFSFSSQTSGESTTTSGGFISAVCEFIVPEFSGFSGKERAEFVEDLQFIVRKSAHFTAYAILGFLSWFALYGIKNKRRYIFAVSFVLFYACTDEFHQHFVEGRSCELRDVLIDTGGGIVGALVALGLTVLYFKLRQTKKP